MMRWKVFKWTMVLAVVCGVAVATVDEAMPWGFGKNKEVTCYHDGTGQPVVLTREVCKLHYQDVQDERANLTYRVAVKDLALKEPPCSDVNNAACALLLDEYNENIVEVLGQPNEAMRLVNSREQRAHDMEIHKDNQKWRYFGLALDIYRLDKFTPSPGHGGDTFIAGDNFNVNGKAGGGSGGAEGSGGGGSGVSIQKSGDNALVWNKSGRMQATLASPSSIQDQDNRREGTEFQPAAAEGSSATFSPDNRSSDDDSVGSLF